MAKNIDNAIKPQNGDKAKKDTESILKNCEFIESLEKGKDFSKNPIERAYYDKTVRLKNHNTLILISSTNSLRGDRVETIDTRMRRVKKAFADQKQDVVCILTSPCDGGYDKSGKGDHRLLDACNFGNREEIGVDIIVKQDDLQEVLQAVHSVQNDNKFDMILAAMECIKKKNY